MGRMYDYDSQSIDVKDDRQPHRQTSAVHDPAHGLPAVGICGVICIWVELLVTCVRVICILGGPLVGLLLARIRGDICVWGGPLATETPAVMYVWRQLILGTPLAGKCDY